MWILVIILCLIILLVVTTFIKSGDNLLDILMILTLVTLLLLIIFSGTTDEKYFSKDIRVGHEVQYKDTLYGEVDSIAYYINGKLINYNEINDIK